MNSGYKFLRWAGPGAVIVLWVGILSAMRAAGLSFYGSMPLSSLGVNEHSDLLFSATLIIAALFLMLFCVYLNIRYKVTRGFTAIFMTGQVAQIVAAIVPFGGSSKNFHSTAAFVLAFSLPLHIWLFAKSQSGKLRQLAYQLLWLELACFTLGIGTFVLTNKVAPLAQSLPAVAFHVWLVGIAFYNSSTEA